MARADFRLALRSKTWSLRSCCQTTNTNTQTNTNTNTNTCTNTNTTNNTNTVLLSRLVAQQIAVYVWLCVQVRFRFRFGLAFSPPAHHTDLGSEEGFALCLKFSLRNVDSGLGLLLLLLLLLLIIIIIIIIIIIMIMIIIIIIIIVIIIIDLRSSCCSQAGEGASRLRGRKFPPLPVAALLLNRL